MFLRREHKWLDYYPFSKKRIHGSQSVRAYELRAVEEGEIETMPGKQRHSPAFLSKDIDEPLVNSVRESRVFL